MNKWVKISDYLFFQEGPGVRNNQYTSEGVKLLNVANLVNGEVDLSTSNRYISVEEAYGKYKHFLADEGDLIIASSGIKVEYFDKKMGFIKKEHLPICMNTSTIRFKSLDINKLNINYFMYYLKSQSFKSQLSKQITGSAQLNFGPSHLKKMKFPIVSLNEQLLINSILGNLDNQIRLKEKQIIEYDSLIKSRFVEMFGDPESNTKKYPMVNLSDIAQYFNGLTYRPENVSDEGIIVLRSSNIQNSKLDFKDLVRVRLNVKENKMVRENDILMCSRNGSAKLVGKVALIDNLPERMAFGAFMMIIRSEYYAYLLSYFQMDAFRRQITTGATTTINQITSRMLDNVKLPLPEMNEVKDFELLVKQIDKLKFAVQKSLDETQTLFDSLMQQYFG